MTICEILLTVALVPIALFVGCLALAGALYACAVAVAFVRAILE